MQGLLRGEISSFMIIMLVSGLQIPHTCKGDFVLSSLMETMEYLQNLADQEWTALNSVPCSSHVKIIIFQFVQGRSSHSKQVSNQKQLLQVLK